MSAFWLSAEQSHEAGETDEPDLPATELGHHFLVKGFPRSEAPVINATRPRRSQVVVFPSLIGRLSPARCKRNYRFAVQVHIT